MPPAFPVPGPITITFDVAANAHQTTVTDILTDTGSEDFVPKVTAITADGCFVRQNSAYVKVLHPGF